jgi:hypothetical protein
LSPAQAAYVRVDGPPARESCRGHTRRNLRRGGPARTARAPSHCARCRAVYRTAHAAALTATAPAATRALCLERRSRRVSSLLRWLQRGMSVVGVPSAKYAVRPTATLTRLMVPRTLSSGMLLSCRAMFPQKSRHIASDMSISSLTSRDYRRWHVVQCRIRSLKQIRNSNGCRPCLCKNATRGRREGSSKEHQVVAM